jgi:hypothetical protein
MANGFDRLMQGLEMLRQGFADVAGEKKSKKKAEADAEKEAWAQGIEERKTKAIEARLGLEAGQQQFQQGMEEKKYGLREKEVGIEAQRQDLQANKFAVEQQQYEAQQSLASALAEQQPGMAKQLMAAGKAALPALGQILAEQYKTVIDPDTMKQIGRAALKLNDPDPEVRETAKRYFTSSLNVLEEIEKVKNKAKGGTDGNYLRQITENYIKPRETPKEVDVNQFGGILKEFGSNPGMFSSGSIKDPEKAKEKIRAEAARFGYTDSQATYIADNLVSNFVGTDPDSLKSAYGPNMKITVPPEISSKEAARLRSELASGNQGAIQQFFQSKGGITQQPESQPTAPTKQLSQEEAATLDWARKNPNDPTAQQFLKLMGY